MVTLSIVLMVYLAHHQMLLQREIDSATQMEHIVLMVQVVELHDLLWEFLQQ